ncbi:RNA polymerase sigma factor [Balneola vulgaris]|uniref:RNA polymerase sigma factor n=1 Tax=Balneola vulgaris TaxID=287535 RepID=UPI00039D9E65|nr:RNA polymerase sigma factor [Balneola vulgaris]
MEESSFIHKLRSRDRSAFNQLVEEYKDQIMSVCYGFLKDENDAEDLTQEVFVEVYRTISKFKEESTLYTWMYRIAVSKSLDELKKRRSLKRAAFFEKRVRSEAADLEMSMKESPDASPEEALLQKQQQQFIHDCLEELPETQRIAFTLSQSDGVSYKEIAEIMDRSLSSIESLVHRSKKNLRNIMEANYEKYF